MVLGGDTITQRTKWDLVDGCKHKQYIGTSVHPFIGAACHLLQLTDACVYQCYHAKLPYFEEQIRFGFQVYPFLKKMKQIHLRVNNSFLKNIVTVENYVICMLQ